MTEDSNIETADSLQSSTQRKYGFMGQQKETPEEAEVKRKYGFAGNKESGEQIRKKHGFMGTDDKSNIEILFGMK